MPVKLRWAVLALLLLAAGWRVANAERERAGTLPAAEAVWIPPPPPHWQLVTAVPAATDPEAPGKAAIYRAPDGSELQMERRVAYPERRDVPRSFTAPECTYLQQGWDFEDRGSTAHLGPGHQARHIIVRKGKDRLMDLSGYASEGRTVIGWTQFRYELLLLRLRRQRPPWVQARVVAPPGSDAARAAPELLLAALHGPASAGSPVTASAATIDRAGRP